MRKLLKCLYILQEKKIKGSGFVKRRMNPYNPISYVALVVLVIAGILMFGFVGIFREVDKQNPFKWD